VLPTAYYLPEYPGLPPLYRDGQLLIFLPPKLVWLEHGLSSNFEKSENFNSVEFGQKFTDGFLERLYIKYPGRYYTWRD
jgi:hypothetical protein